MLTAKDYGNRNGLVAAGTGTLARPGVWKWEKFISGVIFLVVQCPLPQSPSFLIITSARAMPRSGLSSQHPHVITHFIVTTTLWSPSPFYRWGD